MTHPRATIRRVSALVAFVVLIRLPTLWEPRWYSDEGTFTTVAWVHSLGVPLYSGVFDINPPGIYWLYGALLRIGAGQHHGILQAALLFAVLVCVLCTFSIASTWFGSGAGLGAALLTAIGLSLPTLDGDLLNIEIAALPFFLVALVLALQRGCVAPFFMGASLACALLIRPSYVIESVALLVALLAAAPGWRRVLIGFSGGVLVSAAALTALAAGNSLIPYVEQVMPVQRAYVIAANGGNLLPLILRLLLAAFVAIAWFWRARAMIWRPLTLWLPASIAAASITPRELSHYAIEVIPPVAIGVTVLIAIAGRRTHIGNRALQLVASAAALPVAVFALLAVAEATLILPAREVALIQGTTPPRAFLHNFSYVSLPGYYVRWARWVAHKPFQAQELNGFPGPFSEEQAEAELLDRLAAGSTSRIQVLGDRAWVYFLSRLPPATQYIAMNSAYRLIPGADSTVRASLSGKQADSVVVADVSPDQWLPVLESSGYNQVATRPWPTYRHTPTGE